MLEKIKRLIPLLSKKRGSKNSLSVNHIKSILDKNTFNLLQDLETEFSITFEEKDIDYCEVFQQNKKAIIYYNPKIVDTESIAHELLHIWLTKFNYSIGNHIYLACRSDEKLGLIFSKFLCDFISNFFDHHKMYPKYVSMGYSPENFIQNGLELKCSKEDIEYLKLEFDGEYDASSIDKFIGCLMSIYADHVENDYTEHLQLFKKMDTGLFEIVTDYWNSWVDFDIENIDAIYNSERDLTEKFISGMEEWVTNKRII